MRLWKVRYAAGGEVGLVPLVRGREEWKVSAEALGNLNELIRVWRRARPTLCIADLRKSERMEAIHRVLRRASADEEVFYADEADIDLNPRIGSAWMPRCEQMRVPTPAKNKKHYIAGALNARTGTVV